MSELHIYDMIVVGGGPGGYTAALYAVRAGLDTLVLEKLSAGGRRRSTITLAMRRDLTASPWPRRCSSRRSASAPRRNMPK